MYNLLGEYSKAVAFLRQFLEITREIGDLKGEANSLGSLGSAYAKIDEHWKSREHYEQAKDLFTELKLAHMVEKCEKAIQERNRIIARTPKKAPPLPTQTTEPDWWQKSLPTAPSPRPTQPKNSRSKWWPYIVIAVAIILLLLLLR